MCRVPFEQVLDIFKQKNSQKFAHSKGGGEFPKGVGFPPYETLMGV